MLPRLQKQAKEELDAYIAEHRFSNSPHVVLELKRLTDRVKALDQIDETLKQESDGVPRYLMQLDPSGPNILAAVSQNNPDDAITSGLLFPA